ncbi:sterol desaturase family protein [Chitinophaga defluvii]|uniref:Sterol desaturase family protein n=1 Tax=Chitinophaga defluvii TaxID=3163343 RepID=A0ABV2SYT2_9BACT
MDVLDYLLRLSTPAIGLIFLVENVIITILVLWLGKLLHHYFSGQQPPPYKYTQREWFICGVTNILNTVITYIGFWLWKNGFIVISTGVSVQILWDFLILFFAMDLLMYVFHFIIHKTWLYKAVHQLHHEAVDPKPIDLFILHPVETVSFGALWLLLLLLATFNIYAIVIYLVVNVVFGLTGHLGMEPLPLKIRNLPVLRYLGTSTFHHRHHQEIAYNFGFYTSIWDRLFGTHKG